MQVQLPCLLGGLFALALSLSGCNDPSTGDKSGPMETACDESTKRGQCSKCMCIGKAKKCSSAVGCVACKEPYVFLKLNDTNSSDTGSLHFGSCAFQCPDPSNVSWPVMPKNALDYNGKEWPAACFNGTEEQRYFIIGDWGGIVSGSGPPLTFKNRPTVIDPIDTHAQTYVADKMAEVAADLKPKFVLNVGDNFYPGGISSPGTCNAETDKTDPAGQIIFTNVFENVYKGPGLDGVEWWGVLGNHDYGGYHYNVHWDQNIFYTWNSPKSRWLTPALYWKRTAQFRNFSAEFFFVDTNKVDTYGNPDADPEHNICARSHNQPPQPLGCNGTSMTSPDTCWKFFDDLWKDQKEWLAKELQASTAEWQIIVTHYPPNFEPCRSTWESYLVEYGVDFYVSGHTHLQHTNTTFGETAFVISGGGGGITSEILPSKTGEDDGYGFMDVVIQHDAMTVTRYSHGGVDKKTIVRGVTKVSPRSPKAVSQVAKAEPEVAKVVV